MVIWMMSVCSVTWLIYKYGMKIMPISESEKSSTKRLQKFECLSLFASLQNIFLSCKTFFTMSNFQKFVFELSFFKTPPFLQCFSKTFSEFQICHVHIFWVSDLSDSHSHTHSQCRWLLYKEPTCSSGTHTHTHTFMAQSSGAIWASVSCPRTLQHVHQRCRGLNYWPSDW